MVTCPWCGTNYLTFQSNCNNCGGALPVAAEKIALSPTLSENIAESPLSISTNLSFRMTVQDVFTIRNRGTVVTGQIESGTLHVGEEISIQRTNYAKKAVVTAIEMFRKQLQQAKAGDNVGLLLRDIGQQDVKRGDLLLKSDSELS